MMNWINICDMLLKRNEIEPFLKRMIIGDEKWVTYDNQIRERSWTKEAEKQSQNMNWRRKRWCCVYGGIGRELFTMNYYRTVKQLIPNFTVNNWRVGFDDSEKIARAWLGSFDAFTDASTIYSPDIAPSDYHLFRSLQNSLNDIKLTLKEICENHLISRRRDYGSAPKMAKYYRK